MRRTNIVVEERKLYVEWFRLRDHDHRLAELGPKSAAGCISTDNRCWSGDQIRQWWQRRRGIASGLVACREVWHDQLIKCAEKNVVGGMLYAMNKRSFHIDYIVIQGESDSDAMEILTRLMDDLKRRLHPDRRQRIVCEVFERDVQSQCLLRELGFMAVSERTKHGRGPDGEDVYHMCYERWRT